MAGNTYYLAIPEIAAVLAEPFNRLRVYKATSQFGVYTLLNTETLVAEKTAYESADTAGLATRWYRHTFFDTASSNESQQSEPIPALQAPVITFGSLAQRAAKRLTLYGLPDGDFTFPGPSGTTTGAGSTTTFVCSTYSDTDYPSHQFYRWFGRMTSGLRTGEERRITTLSAGTFTVSRAFGGSIASGVNFELYGGLSGSEWRLAVNQALLDLWVPFTWPLAGVEGRTQYTLPAFIESSSQIQNLAKVQGATIRKHRLTGGYEYLIKPLEGGGAYIYLPRSLAANSTYELEGFRHPAMMGADTDTIVLSELNQRLLVTTAAMRAAQQMAIGIGGLPIQTDEWQRRLEQLEDERKAIVQEDGQWDTGRTPRRSQMVGVRGQ